MIWYNQSSQQSYTQKKFFPVIWYFSTQSNYPFELVSLFLIRMLLSGSIKTLLNINFRTHRPFLVTLPTYDCSVSSTRSKQISPVYLTSSIFSTVGKVLVLKIYNRGYTNFFSQKMSGYASIPLPIIHTLYFITVSNNKQYHTKGTTQMYKNTSSVTHMCYPIIGLSY